MEKRHGAQGGARSSKYGHGREDEYEHALSWTLTSTATQPSTVVGCVLVGFERADRVALQWRSPRSVRLLVAPDQAKEHEHASHVPTRDEGSEKRTHDPPPLRGSYRTVDRWFAAIGRS
jgi:hypothetical protein